MHIRIYVVSFIREETTAFKRCVGVGSDWVETTGVSRWSFIHEETTVNRRSLFRPGKTGVPVFWAQRTKCPPGQS